MSGKMTPEEVFAHAAQNVTYTVAFQPYLLVECDGLGRPMRVYWEFLDSLCENDESPDDINEKISFWVDEHVTPLPGQDHMHRKVVGDLLQGGNIPRNILKKD